MNEIARGDKDLMNMLCESVFENVENINSYLDIKNCLAFFLDDNRKIKIERLKKFIDNFCSIYMNKMKNYIRNNPEEFEEHTRKIFEDTFNIFICLINRHNIRYSDEIEEAHKTLINKYNDDVKLNMIRNNKQGKQNLDTIESDFFKLL
jgi:hypothetical protein